MKRHRHKWVLSVRQYSEAITLSVYYCECEAEKTVKKDYDKVVFSNIKYLKPEKP